MQILFQSFSIFLLALSLPSCFANQQGRRFLLSQTLDYDRLLEEVKSNCGAGFATKEQLPGAQTNGTILRQDIIDCSPYNPVYIYSAGNPFLIPLQVKVCQIFGSEGSSACNIITYEEVAGTNSSKAVNCEVRVQPPASAASTDFACSACNLCEVTGDELEGTQVGVTRNCNNLQSVDPGAPSLTTDVCTEVYPSTIAAPPSSSGGFRSFPITSHIFGSSAFNSFPMMSVFLLSCAFVFVSERFLV